MNPLFNVVPTAMLSRTLSSPQLGRATSSRTPTTQKASTQAPPAVVTREQTEADASTLVRNEADMLVQKDAHGEPQDVNKDNVNLDLPPSKTEGNTFSKLSDSVANSAPKTPQPAPVPVVPQPPIPNQMEPDDVDDTVIPPADLNRQQPEPAVPQVSAEAVQSAKDAVTQSEAELKQHKQAAKLDTKIAGFMRYMQTFVEKLEKKYKLPPGTLGALMQLFKQAEQHCNQRVEQRTQQVLAASDTLTRHTREVERLSELASGQQQNAESHAAVFTPQPASPEQSKGLDDLIKQLRHPEQEFVRKAARVAQKVVDGNAPPRSEGRTNDAKALRARWREEEAKLGKLELQAARNAALKKDGAQHEDILFEASIDDLQRTLEDMEKSLAEMLHPPLRPEEEAAFDKLLESAEDVADGGGLPASIDLLDELVLEAEESASLKRLDERNKPLEENQKNDVPMPEPRDFPKVPDHSAKPSALQSHPQSASTAEKSANDPQLQVQAKALDDLRQQTAANEKANAASAERITAMNEEIETMKADMAKGTGTTT